MTLEELLKLLPEDKHDEAKEFIQSNYIDKIETLTNEITELEKKSGDDLQGKLDEAIKKRDKVKAQLSIVREKLGLPADQKITADLIKEYLENSGKSESEKDAIITRLKTDIESLEQTIKNLKDEKEQVEQKVQQIKSETKFMQVFNRDMPEFEPANNSSKARNDVIALLREDAVLEDDKIVYKNSDGSYIRIAGEKMNMSMKLAEIQANPEYDYLFKTKASGGSGSPNGGKGGSLSKFEARMRKKGLK